MRFGGLIATLALFAMQTDASAQTIQLICNQGPLSRTFGGTPWLVYACDDGKSLVVATASDNPASSFMFVIAWGPHGYRVQGEGQGSSEASASAFEYLRALTPEQISTLHASANNAQLN